MIEHDRAHHYLWSMVLIVLQIRSGGGCCCVECCVGRRKEEGKEEKAEAWLLYIDISANQPSLQKRGSRAPRYALCSFFSPTGFEFALEVKPYPTSPHPVNPSPQFQSVFKYWYDRKAIPLSCHQQSISQTPPPRTNQTAPRWQTLQAKKMRTQLTKTYNIS